MCHHKRPSHTLHSKTLSDTRLITKYATGPPNSFYIIIILDYYNNPT